MSAAEILAKVRSDLRAFGAQMDASSDALWNATGLSSAQNLGLDWPELEAVLPDGSLPSGVVEIASPGLAASAIAARAIRSAHRREAEAWCAWLDPEGNLYAPGLAAAGIDLERLLVAQPARAELGRVAVKIAQSGAFDVVVIDMDAAAHAADASPASQASQVSQASQAARDTRKRSKRAWPSEVLVRKLALAVEDGKTHVLLLTDASRPRVTSWPVGMRLDVVRNESSWRVTVGKERRGRIGRSAEVPLLPHHVLVIAPLAKTNVIAPAVWSASELQSRSKTGG